MRSWVAGETGPAAQGADAGQQTGDDADPAHGFYSVFLRKPKSQPWGAWSTFSMKSFP